MLPSHILPLAEHAKFGQNWVDVSIGSKFVCINYSMPMDACFFKLGDLQEMTIGVAESGSRVGIAAPQPPQNGS